MPQFGFNAIGATASAVGADFITIWYLGQATEAGSITSLVVYDANGSGFPFRLALYSGSASAPTTLIAETGEINQAAGWKAGAATGSFSAGTHLWMAVKTQSSISLRRNTDALYPFTAVTAAWANPFPNPYGAFASSGGRRFSGYVDYDQPIGLTITRPVTRQTIGRIAGEVTADIQIQGTASDFTGNLEASFNGGPYQTIATITANGSWSGTLANQPLGAGTLTVRRAAPNNHQQVTVANVLLGRLYLIAGDSISEGRLTNAQSRAGVMSTVWRQDNAWAWSDDPMDVGHSSTTIGSHWPLLAQLLTASFGHPVGFITVGRGSRDVAGSSTSHTYFAKPNQGYTEMLNQSAGAIPHQTAPRTLEAFLIHLGPNAATSSPNLTQQQYRDALTQWAANIRTDFAADTIIYLGIHGRNTAGTSSSNAAIRRALAQVGQEGTFRDGPNLLGPNWSDGIHPKSDADAAITAGRWFAAITGTVPPRLLTATLSVNLRDVVLTYDTDLSGTNGDTYTSVLFVCNGATATTATRISDRQIRVTFPSDLAIGQTLVYAGDELHVGATMPSSVTVPLPVTLHGISSVNQPAAPQQLSLTDAPLAAAARTVTITVLDAGQPVADANVRLSYGAASLISRSNGSGVVVFNVDDGTYSVAITKAGYTFSGASLVVDGDETIEYAVSAIEIIPDIPDQSIGFTQCLNSIGEPVTNQRVYGRMVNGGTNTGYVYNGSTFSELSDSNGLVTFEGLIRNANYEFWILFLGRKYSRQIIVPNAPSFELPNITFGPASNNEPYPSSRRLLIKDLTLFNGEDIPLLILLDHLNTDTLGSIENESLEFTVETSKKVVLLSSLLTVENGSIQVPSSASLTVKRQNLQWSLRWPASNEYITGGRITVAYAPVNP